MCVVFTFVRGDGNKDYYAKSKLMFVVVENTNPEIKFDISFEEVAIE